MTESKNILKKHSSNNLRNGIVLSFKKRVKFLNFPSIPWNVVNNAWLRFVWYTQCNTEQNYNDHFSFLSICSQVKDYRKSLLTSRLME